MRRKAYIKLDKKYRYDVLGCITEVKNGDSGCTSACAGNPPPTKKARTEKSTPPSFRKAKKKDFTAKSQGGGGGGSEIISNSDFKTKISANFYRKKQF
jgi:hypothetical protein